MPDDDAGFFRSLTGLATEWVNARRRNLRTEPKTNVDSSGASTSYSFSDQDVSWEDLRDIKAMREDGGQVAQLMTSKALLNFGEGAEFRVENDDDTETVVDGEPMTLSEWLDDQFPHLDLLVLELGEDALWFPFAAGETLETRGGDYDELLPVDPWTLMPVTDARGRIAGWRQRVNADGGYKEQTLQRDDLWHIVLNKSSARDETGISEVLRSKDEIQAFKENEQAINQAIELHGFPQRHIKAGREDGPPLRDDDLRRLRTIFNPKTSDANTAYFTGPDVDVDTLEAHQFDYTAIHEMDMRNLTTALGLPLEAGNVGSDGLGSGKPAELRFALLKLAIKANQRRFSHQFVDRVIRPIVRQYSPFDADAEIRVEIDDPLEDIGEVADLLQKVGGYMTNSEARQKLDLPDPEDDEIAESFRSPADMESAEEGGEGGDIGGLFRDARTLAEVPDNAVSISDRSEAPEGASVITGPRGGLYYVPGGDGDGDAADGGTADAPDEESAEQIDEINEIMSSDMADWKKRDELSNVVEDNTPVGSVRFDDFTPEQASQASETLVRLNATDQLDGLNGVTSGLSASTKDAAPDAAHVYKPSRATVELSPEYLDEEQAQEWADSGHLAGDSVEHMIAHEVGHHQHFEQDRAGDIDMSEVKDTELTPQEKRIAEQELSTYAATSTQEFVAEAYAVKAGGGELSGPLQDMYEDFGGVEPV